MRLFQISLPVFSYCAGVFLAGALACAQNSSTANPGAAPASGVNATDIYTAFRLSALQDASESALNTVVAGLQVGSRAVTLGLSRQSASDAWMGAQKLYAAHGRLPAIADPRASVAVTFSGSTASALNELIAKPEVAQVEVVSTALSIDQPIEIQRSGFVLDLGTAQIMGANPQPYMVRIENATNITLRHGTFLSGDSAILVNVSSEINVSGVQISGLSGAGITVTGSNRVTIDDNQICAGGLAGIVIHRGTMNSLVEHNQVTGNMGFGNLMAGIVATDREVDLASNPRALFGPDGYFVVAQPMSQRIHPPHDNLIAWNHVGQNKSSGIYLDGATRTIVYSNSVESNSKEGLCLDNGSTANVVTSNTFFANGDRWGDPDSVLALDFILTGGRLADGTAAEKTPGISIDNAIYNIVFENNVSHNFGGGVKTVRTAYFNAIGLNSILDDNDGASASFHFFGVELGAAPGDDSSIELDFTPSRGNVLFCNSIRGSHYSGVFFDIGSDTNNVLDNTILDATNWALESAEQMANSPLNNLTNLPSRNIGSGLDPALLTIGQPVNDTPH